MSWLAAQSPTKSIAIILSKTNGSGNVRIDVRSPVALVIEQPVFSAGAFGELEETGGTSRRCEVGVKAAFFSRQIIVIFSIPRRRVLIDDGFDVLRYAGQDNTSIKLL
jgi:hypothetical protein